jgi:hypothetical protein
MQTKYADTIFGGRFLKNNGGYTVLSHTVNMLLYTRRTKHQFRKIIVTSLESYSLQVTE